MTKAKIRPEIWKIFAALFFTPQNAPKRRNNIHKKWIRTVMSARIL
jgi:hypothetical protein